MNGVGRAGGAADAALSSAPGRAADRGAQAEVRRLAQEFEALLLTQMLRDMRRSMLDGEEESGAMFVPLSDTFDVELGRALSAAGGFGLADVLEQALARLADGAGPRTPDGTHGDRAGHLVRSGTPPAYESGRPAPMASLGSRPAYEDARTSDRGWLEALDVDAPITSRYGWRRDPITGAAAFHAGVDVALAYGQDVRAAAPGRVIFAGESGGYGLMVALAHPDGRQTRYAHLATSTVREGDVVEAGHVIGKSGSSGRATGPHLHFEVRIDGKPVDPAGRGGR